MMRRRVGACFVGVLLVLAGCDGPTGEDAGPDGGTHAGDAGIECTQASDCPTPTECNSVECVSNRCMTTALPPGTPTADQTTGDCRRRQCDGSGGVVSANDDGDLEDDLNPCTIDRCLNGTSDHAPAEPGTDCGSGATTVCNDSGECVGCNEPSECSGADDECSVRTCSAAGVCGRNFTGGGTPLSSGMQAPGDCHEVQCNGTGGTNNVVDNNDVRDDGNDCTDNICTTGTPSNPNFDPGTVCGTLGDLMCDGAGMCVGCISPSNCPGPTTDCEMPACNGGTCGTDYADPGTDLTVQVAGDCQRLECDGTGGTQSVDDDSDTDDGNPCTVDSCSGGVPTHAPAVVFTSCGAGAVCDGGTTCVTSGETGAFWVLRFAAIGGVAAPTNAATPAFVERHAADGSLLGEIALPTAQDGTNAPLTVSGSADSEGGLTRSVNLAYVTMTGYAAPVGTTGIKAQRSGTFHRIVGRIDAAGNIDTSTHLDAAFDGDNVRAAVTVDGTEFWVAGSAGMAPGSVHHVVFRSPGASTALITTPDSSRRIDIVAGQLYASSSRGGFNVYAVGSGIPTSAATAVVMPNVSTGITTTAIDPMTFALFDLNPAVAGVDTIYLADARSFSASGGIQRWSFDGATWTFDMNFGTSGFRGLTATLLGTRRVVLLATRAAGTDVVQMVDDGVTTPTEVVLATAPTNTYYRGIAFPPR